MAEVIDEAMVAEEEALAEDDQIDEKDLEVLALATTTQDETIIRNDTSPREKIHSTRGSHFFSGRVS